MQEFFMDYGLWLLIALLVVIALVFLLSGRKTADALPDMSVEPEPVATPASVAQEPAAVAAPVEHVVAADPPPVEPPVAAAAVIPVSPAVTVPAEAPDDLLKLKGVGPKLRTLLIELGVTRYAQIADWTDADIAMIDAKLGSFKGRPVRDQWIDQARYLAAGDIPGFEARYGKL